jgi:hypothetical protein
MESPSKLIVRNIRKINVNNLLNQTNTFFQTHKSTKLKLTKIPKSTTKKFLNIQNDAILPSTQEKKQKILIDKRKGCVVSALFIGIFPPLNYVFQREWKDAHLRKKVLKCSEEIKERTDLKS